MNRLECGLNRFRYARFCVCCVYDPTLCITLVYSDDILYFIKVMYDAIYLCHHQAELPNYWH